MILLTHLQLWTILKEIQTSKVEIIRIYKGLCHRLLLASVYNLNFMEFDFTQINRCLKIFEVCRNWTSHHAPGSDNKVNLYSTFTFPILTHCGVQCCRIWDPPAGSWCSKGGAINKVKPICPILLSIFLRVPADGRIQNAGYVNISSVPKTSAFAQVGA